MWDKILYDCSDNWKEAEKTNSSLQNVIKKMLIKKTEEEIILSANFCFTSSIQNFEFISSFKQKQPVLLIENGVDYKLFKKNSSPNSSNIERLKIGFIGGLKPWKIDFNLLYEIAQIRLNWEIVLVGQEYEQMPDVYHRLLELPNVQHINNVDYEEVPAYLDTIDIGILPYCNNEYNLGVFPLKFFEYMARDLPIVGCGLPSTREYIHAGIYEYVENDSSLFIKGCENIIQHNKINSEYRKKLAKSADWDEKFKKMLSIVERE
ncbi:putative glycosyltransferase [Bacillus sp. TS-2]|nr:putative glycosyltransferase [Bacillus sp. TS-2]